MNNQTISCKQICHREHINHGEHCGPRKAADTKPEKSEWEELTVKDIQLWLDKLERIQSIGAKVVHVRHLLESEKKKSALEALERVNKGIKTVFFNGICREVVFRGHLDHLKEEYK